MAIFKAGDDEPLPWGTMGYHMFRLNPFGYDLRLERNPFLGENNSAGMGIGWDIDTCAIFERPNLAYGSYIRWLAYLFTV